MLNLLISHAGLNKRLIASFLKLFFSRPGLVVVRIKLIKWLFKCLVVLS